MKGFLIDLVFIACSFAFGVLVGVGMMACSRGDDDDDDENDPYTLETGCP